MPIVSVKYAQAHLSRLIKQANNGKEERATWLPLQKEHIHRLTKLPALHDDPFDRLLIAQSIEENLSIATSDQKFTLCNGIPILS